MSNIERARQIYINYTKRKVADHGGEMSQEWIDNVRSGNADDQHGVQIALAAILELGRE